MSAGTGAEAEAPEIGIGMLGYAFMGKAHSNAFKTIPYMIYPPTSHSPAGSHLWPRRGSYSTLWVWNDLLVALVLLPEDGKRTLMVGITVFGPASMPTYRSRWPACCWSAFPCFSYTVRPEILYARPGGRCLKGLARLIWGELTGSMFVRQLTKKP